MCHVLGISKGLVFFDKFENNGYKLVNEDGSIELTQNGLIVGQAIKLVECIDFT